MELLNFALLVTLVTFCSASRKGGKYCAACHVVVDEIEYEISKIDPKKILELDGFRIDPRGNQMKRRTVPYARSETHLTELTETLCEKMNRYALSTDKETGEEKYILTQSRDGKPITLENISMSGDTAEQLRHMCNSFIEDKEDDILEYFKSKHDDPQKDFCSNVADVCDGGNTDTHEGDHEEEHEEEEEESGKDEL